MSLKKFSQTLSLLLVIVVVLLIPGLCSNQGHIDSRTISLGNSFAGDLNADFNLNPASLGYNGSNKAVFMFSSTPEIGVGKGLASVSFGKFGVSASTLDVDPDYNEKTYCIAYGKQIKDIFAFGISFEGFHMQYGDFIKRESSYTINILKQGKKFSTGVVLTNLAPTIYKSSGNIQTVPIEVRVGFSLFNAKLNRFNLDVDNNKRLYLGYEHNIAPMTQIRFGSDDGHYRIGFGISSTKILVDYAFIINPLINEHRTTLRFKF